MKFKVCVIGCGDMGRKHFTEWNARSDAQVVAVFDPQLDRAKALADGTDARICGSMDEVLAVDGVNVASVCTPVCYHAEMACAAMERGIHTLVEKPIALTLEDAREMIACAEENGVQLGVSLQYRGHPKNMQYRRLVERGDFGGPVFVRYVDIREVRPKIAMHGKHVNGGPVIDMCGHFFDLMRYFTGEEAKSVFASGHVFGRGKDRLAGVEDLAVDAADILVRMSGGHTLSVYVNWGMPEGTPAYTHELLCGPDLLVENADGRPVARYRDHVETYSDFAKEFGGPTARIDDLVQAIRGERPIEVGGQEGLKALEMSIAAVESIATGNVVLL